MNQYNINRNIKLDMPSLYLKKEMLKQNIKKIISEQYCFTFDKQIGYITSIDDIYSIGLIHIDYKGFGNTNVDFKVTCINPKKGSVLSCQVKYVFAHIIIVYIHDIDIIIPYQEIQNLQLMFNKDCFKNADKCIRIGDTVQVEILHTKFSNKKLKCIGKIIF